MIKQDWDKTKKLRKVVGSLIKKHRKSLNMSQTEYAKYVGVGRFSTISSYELGYREAPYRILFLSLVNINAENCIEENKIINNIFKKGDFND